MTDRAHPPRTDEHDAGSIWHVSTFQAAVHSMIWPVFFKHPGALVAVPGALHDVHGV
jgi:hypothetical protein